MATTTNYGWTTPDDTALVKDGASAIRTLGSSVDTTVKALSPGTTAGDVDYYTSSTAKARLGIGSTGQVLTVAGGVPSWATLTGGSLIQLATGTVSSTSTVLSSISQSYKHLYLVVSSVQLTSATDLAVRLNGDTAANYAVTGYTTGSTSFANRTTDTLLYLNGGNGLVCPTTANNDSYTLYIQNYSVAKGKNISVSAHSGTTKTSNSYAWAGYASNTAISSLTLCTSSGTATWSVGTYTLYGVN